MLVGHLGAGLALKKAEPKINVGWLFFMALFFDFLLGIFVLLGLERALIPENYNELHYLYYTFPYSHGLAATILWSGLIFVVVKLLWPKDKGTTVAAIFAAAAFSHFILDWLVHIPEIPLLGQDSLLVGFGLWNYLWVALFIETLILIGGLTLYLRSTSGSGFGANYGMIIFMGIVLIVQVMGQAFGPPPPDVKGPATFWIIQPLIFAALAFWLDRKRDIVVG